MINCFISAKGKRHMVNLITFVDKDNIDNTLEDGNGSSKSNDSSNQR